MGADSIVRTEPVIPSQSGFTLLDGIALVIGAAIASVHLRQAAPSDTLSGAGWVVMWVTFAGVALTASGPFIALIRWRSGRPRTPPRLGDRLWVLLGIPWVLAAIPRIVSGPDQPGGDMSGQLHTFVLIAGLGVATLVTLAIVWAKWVMVPPGATDDEEAIGWTHRVGLTLAVAWPMQCGLAMVVLGSPG